MKRAFRSEDFIALTSSTPWSRLARTIIIAAALGGVTAQATVVTLDFTSGHSNQNEGFTLDAGSGLTISAASGLDEGGATDPLTTTDTGTVYWGFLGEIDDGPANTGMMAYAVGDCTDAGGCQGLGVQDAAAGGSEGVSGGGSDSDEALIFTFANPVDPSTIEVSLVGINNGVADAGAGGLTHGKADKLDTITLYYGGVGTANSQVDFATGYGFAYNPDPTLIFKDLAFPTAGTLVSNFSFALRVDIGPNFDSEGHFGVGGIKFGSNDAVVPEPVTGVMVFFGLAAIAGVVRHRRRRSTESAS